MSDTTLQLLETVLEKHQIRKNESMREHTSFRIGGKADYFVIPSSFNQVKQTTDILKKHGIPYFIMGNGSNLLVRDGGIRGVVIQIGSSLSNYKIEGETVYAQAGILLSALSERVLEEGLEGFEFASGIPGTIGGAMTMNAGAYGGEMKDIVQSVQVLDREGEIREIPCEEMDFGYRRSRVVREGLIVLGATFRLRKGNYEEIKEKIEDFTHRRNTKQPLSVSSAGSTFKRPEGHFAGKLIDDAGLRGICYRDAQVSHLHCGFVINKGNASCEDVLELINMIKKTVYDKFQVELEEEVRIVGEK